MQGVPSRRLRPVICVGYGEDGSRWLRRVSAAATSIPLLQTLMKAGVLQFWAVGGPVREEKYWWNPTTADGADVLRARLDEARRDDLRFTLGGLELQEILILERLRLYDPAC